MTGRIDHLVVTADSLSAASGHVEAALGLPMAPGGRHRGMGTHNRVLSMGASDYLEAIAQDPEAPVPDRRRWFGLDNPSPARLSNWVLRVSDVEAALAEAPGGTGPMTRMTRGTICWRVTLPPSGQTPFDGVFPALIEWQTDPPAPHMDDLGVRLVSLTLSHPRAGALGWALSMITSDDRIIVKEGPVGLSALLHTKTGEVVLT